jgi:serine/threonine protein kinase
MSSFKIGKFQVVETLGTGAASTILKVRRAADSKHYALKVVVIDEPEDKKYLVQAEHEFKIASKLDHPCVLKIHALELHKNWLFQVKKVHLLMEYVNGKTLDAMPRIAVPQLVQIFERVASGLAHLHRRGVYHADIKPSNIMLSRSGDVKILDFGLARLKGEVTERIQGTPEYIAPEQARKGLVNERTDIYNFGATMYRLTTWRLPPSAMPTGEEEQKIDAKAWRRLVKPVQEFAPEAPKVLCDLIHRCLSFDAHQRPERAADIQEQLGQLVRQVVRSAEDRLDMFEF